jgi:Holliday junction DNA helicase RuvA
MPLRDLNLAILLGDVNALSRAPGIGKKTAQRIALELKDKISQADVSASGGSVPASASAVFTNSDSASEAVEALIALGYSSTEARNAISQIRDQADTPEDLIRLALRAMAGM